MPPKQSRQERLEKKRLAERRRLQTIKNDPELKAQLQEKERQKYLKKKKSGKIIPVGEMSPRQQKLARKKSRESSNRYNQKKKLKKNHDLEEIVNYSDKEDSEINSDNNEDPLSLIPHHSSNSFAIESSPPPSPDSDIYATPSRITRSTRRKNLDQTSVHQLGLELEPTSFSDTDTSSSRSPISDIATQSIPNPIRSLSKKQNQAGHKKSIKKTSPWKYLLRKMKYRTDKELLTKDRKIQELKLINEKYRKQINRLKNSKSERKSVEMSITQKSQNKKEGIDSQQLFIETSKTKMKTAIENFFEDDENSRLCPGKKEYVTRHKIRKQKRYLNFNLHQLHQKFLKQHPEYKISYSFFCTLRPFWTVIPNVNARETCLCIAHENMDLAVMALKRHGIIAEKSTYDVLRFLCCDLRNVKCLSRNCNCCKNRHLNYQEFDNAKGGHYWFWTKSKKKYIKDGQEKVTVQSLKQKVLAYPKNIIEHFEKLLEPYMCHCANIVSQNKYIKNLKSNLKSGEFIVHCDFSENYNTKYASEIQSFHFGSSRQQVTLHTSVIYYVKNEEISTKSFCTLSECLRHDAVAIWEHLIPIVNFIEKEVSEVKFLNFISDSPSAQYRNRKMIYVMAKLHWNYPSLRRVVWNYSEKGHGKGAPDGVGGVLKRTADQIVAQGNDIPNIEALISHLKIRCPGVSIEEVVESGILEKELLIPSDLKEFRGTMAVHQAIWSCNNPEVLAMRRLSCDMGICSEESVQCSHGQHIGFYNIGNTALSNNTYPSKTRKNNAIAGCSRTSFGISISNLDHGLDEISVEDRPDINVPSDDSFWTDVPSTNENLMSTTMTKAVLTALHCEDDDSSSDYNIF